MNVALMIDVLCVLDGIAVIAIERSWTSLLFASALIAWGLFNFRSEISRPRPRIETIPVEQPLPSASESQPAKAMSAAAGK